MPAPPPADAELHARSAQAGALAGARQYADAAQRYLDIARADPAPAAAWIGASDCLFALDRYRDARACALAALDGPPVPPASLLPLAQRLRRFEASHALFALAQRAMPTAAPDALAGLASLVSSAGEQQLAGLLVDAALARAPNDPRARYLSGVLCQFDGDTPRAETELELCLHLAPRFAQAHWVLSGIEPRDGRERRLARVRAAIAATPPDGNDEAYLQFALHNELHALGRFDAAWHALERANAVRRAHVRFDADEDAALFAAIERHCGGAFARACAPAPAEDGHAPVPVFIVGMHRSGTSLLERILAGHPQVSDGGETQLFAAQLSLAADHAVAGALDAPAVERLSGPIDFDAVGAGFLEQSRWRMRGRRWFTEKQPANFLAVAHIARALPQARILHLVRDPVDTCFSNLRTYFGRAAPHAFDMRELAGRHLRYQRLMLHWHALLPGRVLDVRYDELVGDTEAVARRVFAFCGLGFVPEALDVARSGGNTATASHAQVRQGILRGRGGAWRPYAAHLAPMLEGLGD